MQELIIAKQVGDVIDCRVEFVRMDGEAICEVTLPTAAYSAMFPDDNAAKWIAFAIAAISKASESAARSRMTNWERMAATMACTFNMRGVDLLRYRNPESQRQHLPFRTGSWGSAVVRMCNSGRQRWYRKMRSPWARWAETVCRNSKRRSEAKNERRKRNGIKHP